MNIQETATLLAKIQFGDARTIGKHDIEHWQEILCDLDFRDADAALIEYRRTQTAWLQPAHIVAIAARHRRERVEAEHAAQLAAQPAPPPVDPQLGLPIAGADGTPVKSAYADTGAITRKCPTCRAPADMPCRNRRTHEPRKIPCLARLATTNQNTTTP